MNEDNIGSGLLTHSLNIGQNWPTQFIRWFRELGFLGFRNLRFVKFQFPIISLVSFCNYSLFFLNLKNMLDIKDI